MKPPSVFPSAVTSDESLLDSLWGNAAILWKEYNDFLDTSVWKNYHLRDGNFLYLTGTLLTTGNGVSPIYVKKTEDYLYGGVKFLTHGHYNTVRFHFCDVQDPGSGKTECNQCTIEILDQMNCRAVFDQDSSTAGLVGSSSGGSKNSPPKVKFGSLTTHHAVIVDEGSMLFEKKQPTHKLGIHRALQSLCNEPAGKLGKSLAEPIYSESICSLHVSSYYTADYKRAALDTGLFQRLALSYHDVTREERRDYQKNKPELAKPAHWDRVNLRTKFITSWKKLTVPAIAKLKEAWNRKDTRYVSLTEHVGKEFNETTWLPVYDKLTALFDEGTKQDKTFQSFLARDIQLYHTSAIIAAMNGKQYIETPELEIGLNIYLRHLWGAYQLISREPSTESEIISEENLITKFKKVCIGYSKNKVIALNTIYKHMGWSPNNQNRDKISGLIELLKEEEFLEIAKNSKTNSLTPEEISALNITPKRLAPMYVYRILSED